MAVNWSTVEHLFNDKCLLHWAAYLLPMEYLLYMSSSGSGQLVAHRIFAI